MGGRCLQWAEPLVLGSPLGWGPRGIQEGHPQVHESGAETGSQGAGAGGGHLSRLRTTHSPSLAPIPLRPLPAPADLLSPLSPQGGVTMGATGASHTPTPSRWCPAPNTPRGLRDPGLIWTCTDHLPHLTINFMQQTHCACPMLSHLLRAESGPGLQPGSGSESGPSRDQSRTRARLRREQGRGSGREQAGPRSGTRLRAQGMSRAGLRAHPGSGLRAGAGCPRVHLEHSLDCSAQITRELPGLWGDGEGPSRGAGTTEAGLGSHPQVTVTSLRRVISHPSHHSASDVPNPWWVGNFSCWNAAQTAGHSSPLLGLMPVLQSLAH